MIKTEIVNVVATASLGPRIEFGEIGGFKEILHDSKVYGGRVAYFKTKKMQGRISVFNSGKMISVGTKNERQAFKELEVAKQFLVNKGFAKQIKLQPQIHNLVVAADLEKSLNLEELSEKLGAIYEPEQFPGVILRSKKPFKATILLFASGKAVIAGLKSSEQIGSTIQKLEQLVESE